MKKLLHIISSMDPRTGGVAEAVRTFVPALHQVGAESHVLCMDDQAVTATTNGIESIGQGRGVWCYNPALSPWLNKSIANFDAVIMHGMWQYTGYAVARAMRRLRQTNACSTRHFIMPHGMLDPWFQRDKSRQLKAYRNWLYWKLVERHSVNQCDGLLFTCERERDLASLSFRPFRPRSQHVIGLGVDQPPDFAPCMREEFLALCPAAAQRDYWLFLGRLNPKKGVELLIDQYAAIAQVQQPDKCKLPLLVIAGPLDSPYADAMIGLARRHGLLLENGSSTADAGIVFTGMLRHGAKWGALYGCEAFVLPSHQENFGIAVVEALACRRPVLISNQINIYSEIEKAGAAIVASDDAEGTRRLMERALRLTPTERREMGYNALACYQNCFRPAAAAQKLLTAVAN